MKFKNKHFRLLQWYQPDQLTDIFLEFEVTTRKRKHTVTYRGNPNKEDLCRWGRWPDGKFDKKISKFINKNYSFRVIWDLHELVGIYHTGETNWQDNLKQKIRHRKIYDETIKLKDKLSRP